MGKRFSAKEKLYFFELKKATMQDLYLTSSIGCLKVKILCQGSDLHL